MSTINRTFRLVLLACVLVGAIFVCAQSEQSDERDSQLGLLLGIAQEPAAHPDDNHLGPATEYMTVWIETGRGVRSRLSQDLIIPRKGGFWRVAVNDSRAQQHEQRTEALIGVAPISAPRPLFQVTEEDGCRPSTSQTITFVGSELLAAEQYTAATSSAMKRNSHTWRNWTILPMHGMATPRCHWLPSLVKMP